MVDRVTLPFSGSVVTAVIFTFSTDENGVITIPVTVSEEQITNGAAIAFTVVTEDTGDGVNLTAPEDRRSW
mgnify:CR=1 FL=1